MSRPTRGLLSIAVTAALWGTVPIATNGVYQVSAANALSIGFFRLAFSLPVLTPVALFRTGRADWRLGKHWSEDTGIPIAAGLLVGEALVGVGAAIWAIAAGG